MRKREAKADVLDLENGGTVRGVMVSLWGCTMKRVVLIPDPQKVEDLCCYLINDFHCLAILADVLLGSQMQILHLNLLCLGCKNTQNCIKEGMETLFTHE